MTNTPLAEQVAEQLEKLRLRGLTLDEQMIVSQAASLLVALAASRVDGEWAEDQLIEVMRLASKGLFGEQEDAPIDDTLRLHAIRLLVDGQEEQFNALLDRVQRRATK